MADSGQLRRIYDTNDLLISTEQLHHRRCAASGRAFDELAPSRAPSSKRDICETLGAVVLQQLPRTHVTRKTLLAGEQTSRGLPPPTENTFGQDDGGHGQIQRRARPIPNDNSQMTAEHGRLHLFTKVELMITQGVI